MQVWLQACSSLPDGRPHVRPAGPGLDAPGAASGQPSAGSPQERATFLHLGVSQTQNHFLSKSHDSPQRADQQAYAASFVLAETGGPSSPTLSKERPKTQETQLESRHRYYFTSTGTGPLPRVKPWARGWDCDVRGCGPCEPLQTCFPKCSARLGAETVGAQRGFLEEATPKSTLQGGREEGREKKIQAEGTA